MDLAAALVLAVILVAALLYAASRAGERGTDDDGFMTNRDDWGM